ncbi:P-loop containing nucleoside triphosphate hydrolase protein [Protomyces lactucae-debilis]|uniref:RNA helicase n=1 Tax=Protomyces lactucae-debilis TaxID=2754530 RepID=A0A1Y2FS97_PROLT|nr:P-loop containing nucleoside triphosphate hydrolase protein [Protomyces lactucae-debilis]ORY86882.1 P-loop containing nucleoside triphosphate hydrolase protein [Protomyces lactucae-debilis]
MPPKKARYNDKARAGMLAKQQALRNARRHGRHNDEPEVVPKSKKQKRLDKYIERKLRDDEKVKLMGILSKQEKSEGMASSRMLKRTKGQQKKESFEPFAGFSGSESEESSPSEDESYLKTEKPEKIAPNQSGFSKAAVVTISKKRKRPALKYNWRAKLEEEKRRKTGVSSDEGDSSEGSEATSSSEDEAQSVSSGIEEATESTTFKEWALEQTDMKPQNQVLSAPTDYKHTPRRASRSPEPNDISDLAAPDLTPVLVTRPTDLEESRALLPAFAHEQEIVEKIKTHSTVIISGATGSGKTTQVPQFLFEAGFTGIGVTQPRRVAAVSMARRVAAELGDRGAAVGYQIRFDSNVKASTQIKFMTDGVLLRELALDLTLSKYQILIIDEAHERSINTDILIGVLSRVIRLRKDTASPLRLVIMSATLRVSDFANNTRLFAVPPPILSIEARQHPVGIHFSRRTEMSSYVEEACSKVVKIHDKLPPGGILVFLTGQQEIEQCARLLQEKFGSKAKSFVNKTQVKLQPEEIMLETEDFEIDAPSADDYDGDSDLSDIEETEQDKALAKDLKTMKHVQILPLYSLLPTTEQMRIFEPVPAQTCQIILATNVAETSLTIPGIRYVVDSGRAKEKVFDGRVQSFQVGWISKASADQRSGRAGRTGPGHCYRLFSAAVYGDQFVQHAAPEILQVPIEGVVLQMKSMNIHTIVNFPFPTAPDRQALSQAEKLLHVLGALRTGKTTTDPMTITEIGRTMSLFPLTPRFGKMLVLGNQQPGLLAYVIALVSALSVGELFSRQDNVEGEADERNEAKQAYGRAMNQLSGQFDYAGDVWRSLAAVCAYDYASDKKDFCREFFVRHKAAEEVCKLRLQLTRLVNTLLGKNAISSTLRLKPPTSAQKHLLKQILTAGFIDQVARLEAPSAKAVRGNLLKAPYAPLVPIDGSPDNIAFAHPACYTFRKLPEAPEFVLYAQLTQAASGTLTEDGDEKQSPMRLQVLCPIDEEVLLAAAQGTPLLKFGTPLDYPPPTMLPIAQNRRRREVYVVPRIGVAGSGRRDWMLPAVKRTQVLQGTRWVNDD